MPRKNLHKLINSCLHAQISKYEDDVLCKLTVQINTDVTTEHKGNAMQSMFRVVVVLWIFCLQNAW